MRKESKPFYHTAAWKKVRAAALMRDHGMCVMCMTAFEHGGAKPRRASLVHHVKPLEEWPELALSMDNLQSLCEICHNKVHPEKGAQGDAGKAKDSPLIKGVRIINI